MGFIWECDSRRMGSVRWCLEVRWLTKKLRAWIKGKRSRFFLLCFPFYFCSLLLEPWVLFSPYVIHFFFPTMFLLYFYWYIWLKVNGYEIVVLTVTAYVSWSSSSGSLKYQFNSSNISCMKCNAFVKIGSISRFMCIKDIFLLFHDIGNCQSTKNRLKYKKS